MLLRLFLVFLKIGAFTIGGGYAMVPLIQEEVVNRKKWIPEDEFIDLLALAQSAPGLLAANTAIFIGYKLRGLPGAIIATLGAALPSFCIILLIAICFTDYADNPTIEAIFKGIRPAVVALIAAPIIKMAKSAHITYKTAVIPIATAIIIWRFRISPALIIIIAILVGLIIGWNKKTQE